MKVIKGHLEMYYMQNDTFLTVKMCVFIPALNQITVYLHSNEVLSKQMFEHHYSTKLTTSSKITSMNNTKIKETHETNS